MAAGQSAHVRLMGGALPPQEVDLADLVMCEIGELEWLYSARSATNYERQRSSIHNAFAARIAEVRPELVERRVR